MGSIDIDDLDPSRTGREPAEVLLGRTQVGGRPLVDAASAMEVGHVAGVLTYLGETRVHVGHHRRSVMLAAGPATWLRLEVKLLRDGRPEPAHLLLAEHPWSGRYAEARPFRPATKRVKGTLDAAVADDPLMASDSRRLLEHVEGLSFDLFETNSKILTAAVSTPLSERANHTLPEQTDKRRQVLGFTVEDPARLLTELMESEAGQTLLRVTENGTIKFTPKERLKRGAPPPLAEEARDRAAEFLALAARQALAGPPDTKSLPSSAWEGRAVTELMSLIYRDHLYNANRRILRRDGKTDPAESF